MLVTEDSKADSEYQPLRDSARDFDREDQDIERNAGPVSAVETLIIAP